MVERTTVERTTAKVEVYSLTNGARVVGNGWLVARYDGSRRLGTLKRFGVDETAARAYAQLWNGPGVVS
jgi:hypothetical protein